MNDNQDSHLNRRRFLTMSAIGGATALAGCGGRRTEGDDPGGSSGATFVDTTAEDAPTLDPRMNELAWVNSMSHYLFDGLLMIKPDGSEIVPHLAKEKPTREDETTYTFQLREGVKFHDGSELTAEDVAYTFEWILDPDNESTNRENLSFVDTVEATGEYEATFHLDHPFALFELTLTEMNAAIVPKAAAEEMGQEEFAQKPVGTGPFQFKAKSSGAHVTLERFDDYFVEAPKLKELKYRIIPEAQTQFVSLSSGDVHQASIPEKLLGEAEGKSNLEMKRISQFDYNGLIFNAKREPFDDRRVREAMQYLVDYDEMLARTKGDLGRRTYGFMPQEVNEAWEFPWQEWRDEYYPDKDHDRAQQLLEEAGYGDGFEVTISTLASGKFKNMAIVLQNEMDQVGIDAQVQERDTGGWLDQLDTGEYDVNIYGWSGGQDPDGFYYYLFRNPRNDDGGVPDGYAGNASAGMLYDAYPNNDALQRADEKIREARKLQDRDERRKLYVDVAETFQSEYPHIPVYSEQTALAWQDTVTGYDPTGFSQQPLCNHWSNASIEG